MGQKHSKSRKKKDLNRAHSTVARKAKTMLSNPEIASSNPNQKADGVVDVQVIQVSSLAEEYAAYGLPKRNKEVDVGADTRIAYACGAMQGWRDSMEDAHVALLKLPFLIQQQNLAEKSFAFFAVYDGHGGDAVSRYAGDVLHRRLIAHPKFAQGDYPAAVKETFWSLDHEMRKDQYLGTGGAGCTAITLLITPENEILCGNAGDCRAVLSNAGVAVALSTDHKPTVPSEAERIYKSGGRIEDDRVEGDLAVSRALGDFEYKPNPDDPYVSPEPDIVVKPIIKESEFVIMACDGIWDCLRSQEAVDFVRTTIIEGRTLAETTELLLDRCLAKEPNEFGIGCDNMSVVLIAFLKGRSLEEWARDLQLRKESCETDSTAVQSTTDGKPAGGYAATAYSIRRGHGKRSLDAQPVNAKGVDEMNS